MFEFNLTIQRHRRPSVLGCDTLVRRSPLAQCVIKRME